MSNQSTQSREALRLERLAQYEMRERARAYNAHVQRMANPRGALRPCS